MPQAVELYGVPHSTEYTAEVKERIRTKLRPGIKVGVEIPRTSIDNFLEIFSNSNNPKIKFWVEIVHFLKQGGASIVPLDVDLYNFKGPKNHRWRVEENDVIPRDIAMTRTIVNEKVDVALVGYTHLAAVYKRLKLKGVHVRGHQWKRLNRVQHRTERSTAYAESLQRLRRQVAQQRKTLRP